jgi:hypothetical protein
LAAKLRKRRYRVTARTADGVSPSWRVEPDEIDEWISTPTRGRRSPPR